MVLGVDVSNHQGSIDWASVAATGVVFAVCKASESTTFRDAYVQSNLAGCRANRIIPGAYHFLRGGASGAAQCDAFLHAVGSSTDLVYALDVEVGGAGGQVESFLSRFTERLPGRQILLYSNRGLWSLSRGSAVITRYPVIGWHAGYTDGRYTAATGSLAAQWGRTSLALRPFGGIAYFPMVQFTDHARVPGISGLVDGNAWLGSVRDLVALTGTATPPQAKGRDDVPIVVNHPGNDLKYLVMGDTYRHLPSRGVMEVWLRITGMAEADIPNIDGASLTMLRNAADDDRLRDALTAKLDLVDSTLSQVRADVDDLLSGPTQAIDVQQLAAALAPLLSTGATIAEIRELAAEISVAVSVPTAP